MWESMPEIDPQLVSHIFTYHSAFLGQYCYNAEWIKEFFEKVGDVDVQFCEERRTPLFWACMGQGRISLLHSLIAHGANVNARDSDSETPLHMAVLNRAEEVVYSLFDAGASVNAKDNALRTPLHFCADPAIMRALLRAGADPNAKNFIGDTPLMNAVVIGNEEALPILLAYGARVSDKNDKGLTALDLASRNRRFSETTRKILRDAYQAEQAKNSNRKEAP